MSSSRGNDILEHALADFERAADDASREPDDVAMIGLGAFDSIDVIAKKWRRKHERGDKKRLSDFAKLEGWQRRWLAAARRVGHPSLEPPQRQVDADLKQRPT